VPAPHRLPLFCHPATPCPAVRTIEVAATPADDGGLTLNYFVHGDPPGILLPATRPPRICDGLWQHTCCELFIAAGQDPETYREFNFSPSGEWAAYGFTGYRQRDDHFRLTMAPTISIRRHADGFELTATLAASALPADHNLQLGLTAVIEASDGSKSYWALGHHADQPDFHLRQSFSLNLKAASA
jgi:hypothetical protein